MIPVRVALYCSSDKLGGLEKHIVQLLYWMNERGNDTVLITAGKSLLNNYAVQKGIRVSEIPLTERFVSVSKAHDLATRLKQEQCNIVFIIRPRDIATVVLARYLFRRKLSLIFYQLRFISLYGNRKFYSLLFRPFRFWLVAMKFLATDMHSLRYPKASRIRVVPPCVDIKYFGTNVVEKISARKKLELPADARIFGVLGNLTSRNKHDFLIRAIQFLKVNGHKTDLLIMGVSNNPEQKEYARFLKLLVKECQVEDRVHFRPFPENMPVFFGAVDSFVVNKRIKPYDMAIVKALASGVPVMAQNSDTNSQLLEEGNLGLLYKSDDLEDFAAKAIRLLTQEKITEHFRVEGVEVAREKYNKDDVCAQLEEIIALVNAEK